MPCGDLREQGLEVRGSPACAGTKEVGGGLGRGEAAGQRRWAAWPGPSLQQEGGGPEDGPGRPGWGRAALASLADQPLQPHGMKMGWIGRGSWGTGGHGRSA